MGKKTALRRQIRGIQPHSALLGANLLQTGSECLKMPSEVRALIHEEGKMQKTGYLITGSSIIWAAVILGTAFVLKDTPYWAQMIPVLIAGAGGTIGMIWTQRGA